MDPADPSRRVLDRVAAGDPGALAEVYSSHARPTFGLAYRITRSVPDAQDVVHDVFSALPGALASYRGEGKFGGWFRKYAASHALVHLRTRRRRQEVELQPDDPAPIDDGVAPLERIELELAIGRLSQNLRVIVVLCDIEGFTHEDIGAMLGISASASRMRLMRAHRKLRETMGGNSGRMGRSNDA